uniref:Putative ovule protein n=1 Tax=Solanum chacoense TaxID=4108 RepID=A0A0V0HB00_SOLCH
MNTLLRSFRSTPICKEAATEFYHCTTKKGQKFKRQNFHTNNHLVERKSKENEIPFFPLFT